MVYYLHRPPSLYLHRNKAAGQLSLNILAQLVRWLVADYNKLLLSLVALFVWLACVLHACIIVCPGIRLCQIYIMLCCTPFFRSQDRQRFEDPVFRESQNAAFTF